MKKEETIDYHIKTAWHAIARWYNAEAAKEGFTMTIGYVLINIDEKLGTPATRIGPMLGLEMRSLTRTLKNMEETGLIYRTNDAHDKRMVRICLTAEGLRKRDIAKQTVRAFNYVIREQFPPAKLATFFEVIGEMNRLIENNQLSEIINHHQSYHHGNTSVK
ncbi:DNA-binding transcriptional regulator, MarR family [Catalinimonas alkaloidigena]|uniref:DNA-binding transcriptional regulator, MarR family n=1 Tax=Catalinimonas alkaloidigena TaxID=1075417 RepID=A0A1G9EVN6_9BACT|nr:MarR family winged helix-turn-helix transcriptional regulator [Catalinimonas alkaloidigena]SDK80098.1 DNA-binding transcriptional regulator, MarR family [Catalinimonas alkaloidigena]